jgi:hypothetical protein
MEAVMTETLEQATIDAYHRDVSRDSSSSLRLFEESRERYAAIRVFGTLQPAEPTPAMRLGNVLDAMLLDEENFAKRYTLAPKCDRRTAAGKRTWADFCATANGRTVITVDEFEQAQAMCEGVRRNLWARHWLEADGDRQRTFTWEHAATGLGLKCRTDKALRNGLIGDLKMTGRSLRPDAWARTCLNYVYHGQAALYLDGTGADTWVWVVVSDEPPHECAVYAMGPRTRKMGQYRNEATLHELAECKRSGDWSGEFSRDLHEVELPEWELRKVLI